MARTASQVAAWAKRQKDINSGGWKGLCLKFARMAAGAPGGVVDANAGWARAKYKHRGDRTVPRGGIVWYAGGRHGHVAVSAGDGDIYSNDIVESGKIDRVPLNRPEQKWGQRYLGWSEDVNGVHIAGLGTKTSPTKATASSGTKPKPKPPAEKLVNVPNHWYHVDPKKVTTGLNWYGSDWRKRGVRRPNFNVLVTDTVVHNGHKYGVTKDGNRYRLDYLAYGRHG